MLFGDVTGWGCLNDWSFWTASVFSWRSWSALLLLSGNSQRRKLQSRNHHTILCKLFHMQAHTFQLCCHWFCGWDICLADIFLSLFWGLFSRRSWETQMTGKEKMCLLNFHSTHLHDPYTVYETICTLSSRAEILTWASFISTSLSLSRLFRASSLSQWGLKLIYTQRPVFRTINHSPIRHRKAYFSLSSFSLTASFCSSLWTSLLCPHTYWSSNGNLSILHTKHSL